VQQTAVYPANIFERMPTIKIGSTSKSVTPIDAAIAAMLFLVSESKNEFIKTPPE
jgi:hypothetical protein